MAGMVSMPSSSQARFRRCPEMISYPYDTYPEIIYLQKERLEELHNAIETLPKRQKTWIIEHYGFNDENEPCSLAGMCRRYYITPISAKKLDNEALEMVSKKIGVKRPAKAYKKDNEDEDKPNTKIGNGTNQVA